MPEAVLEEQIAESSTAPVEQNSEATPEPERNFDLSSYTDAEREKWQYKGEYPLKKASEPSKVDPAPTSEPQAPEANKEAKKKTKSSEDTEIRIQELLKDRAEAKKEANELRERLAKLEVTVQPKVEVKTEPKPVDSGKPVLRKVSIDDFTKEQYNEYEEAKEAARVEYADAIADWKADQKIAALKEEQKAEKEKDRQKTQEQLTVDTFQKAHEAILKEYSDFDEVAFSEQLPINDATNAYIRRKPENGLKILYALGKDLDLAKKIAAMDADDTAEALAEIRLSSAKSKAEPVKTTLPVKKTSSITPPPVEIKSNGNSSPDDLLADIVRRNAAGDPNAMKEYMEIMNTRELAARRGR